MNRKLVMAALILVMGIFFNLHFAHDGKDVVPAPFVSLNPCKAPSQIQFAQPVYAAFVSQSCLVDPGNVTTIRQTCYSQCGKLTGEEKKAGCMQGCQYYFDEAVKP